MSRPTQPTPSSGSGPAQVIAIDGPAGAGKSTASHTLARRLGFFLLDTGAIYRALALAARTAGVAWDDEAGLALLARDLPIRFVPRSDAAQAVLLGDADISLAIRTPEISDGASRVSSLPAVRAALLELQRSIAGAGGCVVEGRDIGTVVLPWAPVKFFVTASPEERARRRHLELCARGEPSDLVDTLAGIIERDRRDETREAAPLRPAVDAVHIDTSPLGLEEVVDRMERIARERLRLGG
ncbi:MAG: (d)CMP kinase [Myxococcales bacterium]|nr:(d)CMP kinase [Myxococcales bacterium]